jgi:hypothetical protein
MGLQIQTGFAYRLTALTALTMPPEPRLGRIFPNRVRSKVTGPRLEAMIRERSENNSRTKRRSRAARLRVVNA